MAPTKRKARITFKRAQPNPLFQSWLETLHEEAKEKGSKLEPMLKEALESLSKYPLPLQTGAECAILKGFGKKLCSFLDKKLNDFNLTPEQESSNEPTTLMVTDQTNSLQGLVTSSKIINNKQNDVTPKSNSKEPKSSKLPKEYKPAFRSGGYAILIALNSSGQSLKKEELIDIAQSWSEESFTHPKAESHYTAWSNMARLITKGLVNKTKAKQAKFSLTEKGRKLASELLMDSQRTPTNNDIIFSNNPSSTNIEAVAAVETNSFPDFGSPVMSQSSLNDDIIINMPGGSFDIILLIDKAETRGLSRKNDPTVTQFNKYASLKHEYRHLKVGDFAWIARSKSNKDDELVLPYIVERKRMDDLGASIKDGRFHEQKFRLRRCGLANVIYLVEHNGSNKHVGLPLQSLMQALSNTRVQDGFKIQITESFTQSVRFLAILTRTLELEYEKKSLSGRNAESPELGEELMTFSYFNKSSAKSKPLSVTETFIKILLQLRGMSVEKALAITKSYATPKALMEAYKDSSLKKGEGEMLLSNLKYGNLNRNVGPSVSKCLYQLFSIKDLK